MIEITDSLKNETTAWADQVIERFKTAMRSGETYLRWNEPLIYRKGGDAWVDESWWIETARELFAKQNTMYDGLGGIDALEILVFHYPEQFKEVALAKIDKHYRGNEFFDWETVYHLIENVSPNHPLAVNLLESYQGFYELAALVNMRNPSAFELCRKFISDSLEESYLFDVWVLFDKIDKKLMNEVLPQNIIEQVYENALQIAIQPPNSEGFDPSILYSAIKYNWDDVVDKLAENREFIDNLQSDIAYYGGQFDCKIILEWSLSSKKDLTQKLVMMSKQNLDVSTYLDELNLNLNSQECEPYKLDKKIKVEKSIQLAIAWKRSLET